MDDTMFAAYRSGSFWQLMGDRLAAVAVVVVDFILEYLFRYMRYHHGGLSYFIPEGTVDVPL